MTGGLSYCLYIVAAITLHTTSFLTTAYSAINNLTDIRDSRQFKLNMEASKFKDNPHWLENYKLEPLKKVNSEKRPFWESSVTTTQKHDDPKQRDMEEWKDRMRKISNERLKKWYKHDSKNAVDEVNDNGTKNPEYLGLSFASRSSTENLENVKSEFDIEKNERIKSPVKYRPGRWGMSMNEPPEEFLKKISENDKLNGNEHKKLSISDTTDDDDDDDDNPEKDNMSTRFLSVGENNGQPSELTTMKSEQSQRTQTPEHFHKPAINNTTTKLSKTLSTTVDFESVENEELLNKALHLDEKKISNRDNAIDETAIRLAEGKSRIFAPIFILGPTIWFSKLPKSIKQKLQIHPPINLRNRIELTQTIDDYYWPSKKSDDTDYNDAL